jgi:hypothetical protein
VGGMVEELPPVLAEVLSRVVSVETVSKYTFSRVVWYPGVRW